ncbi:hypothetical protein ABTM08_20025, partial [Acinetobacter baumannii]
HEKMTTTREVWINVHGDLQFVPRIRAVSSYLKATFKSDPLMQADASGRQRLDALLVGVAGAVALQNG